MADARANFAYTTVATPPSPALSGPGLTVSSGAGALFPAVPFNATVWPAGSAPLSSNAEIVRVTARTGDNLTILRAQEGTNARLIQANDQIAATITVKTFTDLDTDITGRMRRAGTWSSAATYAVNDVVVYDGQVWVCTAATGPNPTFPTGSFSALARAVLTRATATATTGALAVGVGTTTTIDLGVGYRLYSIATSRPARVRLYETLAQQGNDINRAIGTDPAGSAGVVLDYATGQPGQVYTLSPLVDGASLEATPSISIPMTVTNLDATSGPVTVTLVSLRTE